MGLSSGKFLLRREVDKVAMVQPNFNGVLLSFEVVPECFKSSYNREELQIVDLVIALSWLERLGIICNRVPPIQCVGLF